MRLKLPLLALSLIACGGSPSSIPTAMRSSLPPVRSLGDPDASIVLGTVMAPSVRILNDHRALISDSYNRRLAMVDLDAKTVTTLFDAQTPAPLTYAAGRVPLVAGRGDTTLMFDNNTRGYRVLDGNGRVVRRLGINDAALLRGLSYPGDTPPALDSEGRLVYVQPRNALDRPVPGMQPQPDSFMVTRISFVRPGWDSLTAVKMGGTRITVDTVNGQRRTKMVTAAISVGDAWAMMPNGTVAVIRSNDFHVDWIEPNGARRRSRPVPWNWHRFTTAEKDSILRARDRVMGSLMTRVVDANGNVPPPTSTLPQVARLTDTIPDLAPAFVTMSALSDPAGRIWVRLGARVFGPEAPVPFIYGVLDAAGQMIDRVSFPPGHEVVGFGKSGQVFVVKPTLTREGVALARYSYGSR